MLEKINLKKTMIDAEYKQVTRALKADLSVLQHSLKERKIPVIVLFDGWGAAGKGSIIADVILNLDPRNFKVMSTLEPTEEERRHPFLWRHWCRIPARGRIAIFDRSWYPEVSVERVEKGLKMCIRDRISAYESRCVPPELATAPRVKAGEISAPQEAITQ